MCVLGERGANSWFAHLAVNQPFDVPNINRVIYIAGGGSDEVEVTDTLSLHTEAPAPRCMCVLVVCQCVYLGKVDSTCCFPAAACFTFTRTAMKYNYNALEAAGAVELSSHVPFPDFLC